MNRTKNNDNGALSTDKRSNRFGFWGTALIIGGLYWFFQNLGLATGAGELLFSLLWGTGFGIAALVMLSLFATNPTQRWWAAIPGFIFGGIAAATLIEQFIPIAEPITGPLFLGSIGAAFATIYLFNQEQWWAIIPAGVMTSLAIVAGIDELPILREAISIDTGAIFLMGISLTFLAVSTLSVEGEKMTWALIPAGVLMVIVLIAEANLDAFVENIWPLILIIGGGTVLWRKYVDGNQLGNRS